MIAFQGFLRLCAGIVGRLLNLSALGSDAGVTHATARAWISVLEASYIAHRLAPWASNVGKRVVKTPGRGTRLLAGGFGGLAAGRPSSPTVLEALWKFSAHLTHHDESIIL